MAKRRRAENDGANRKEGGGRFRELYLLAAKVIGWGTSEAQRNSSRMPGDTDGDGIVRKLTASFVTVWSSIKWAGLRSRAVKSASQPFGASPFPFVR